MGNNGYIKMTRKRTISKGSKLQALEVLKSAKSFFMFTITYDGDIVLMGDTAKADDMSDIRQMALRNIESYGIQLSDTATNEYNRQKKTETAADDVAKAKEARSEMYRQFSEDTDEEADESTDDEV